MHSPLESGLHPRSISDRPTSTHAASMQACSGPQGHDDDAIVSGEHAGNVVASNETMNVSEENVW
jgi:hypothetical protein